MSSSSAVWWYSIVPLAIALLIGVYRWSTATFDFFRQRDVRCSRPWPLVGNLATMLTGRQTSVEIAVELYERFKHEA